MAPPLAYLNGRFLPLSEVAIPLDDAGFVWGATVTDRLRTFNGRLFALDAHLRRFRRSCDLACVPQPVPNAQLGRITEYLVRENRHGGELSATWIATPGAGSGSRMAPSPTLIAYTSPLDAQQFDRQAAHGIHLIPVPATLAVDPRVKHRSRLPWWIARREVESREALAEPLLIEPGFDTVLETPTANFLSVLDGAVVSPPRETVLPGVTLGVVEDLCRHLGIRFSERRLTLPDLHHASEMLLANTIYCLAGVSRLGDRSVPFPGPMLDRLLDTWSQWVGVDIRRPTAGRS
jgi:branched-subunit amino acid aminotransferase/4-amino-4-deoxychorismate lyase